MLFLCSDFLSCLICFVQIDAASFKNSKRCVILHGTEQSAAYGMLLKGAVVNLMELKASPAEHSTLVSGGVLGLRQGHTGMKLHLEALRTASFLCPCLSIGLFVIVLVSFFPLRATIGS